jgi:isochorismate hydrolase
VIDVQGKLAELMTNRDTLFENLVRLIRGAYLLRVPLIWTEQVPEKLGPTTEVIRREIGAETPISKSAFSCLGEPMFVDRLESLNRHTVVLCGIEAHVCVYQTALDLVEAGYRVEVVSDAVSSRRETDLRLGLGRMKQAGVGISGVEMLLFELQQHAQGDDFRRLIQIVK